jgi:septum formation protein
MKVVLATTSPRRIEFMNDTKIPFEAIGSDVEEYFEGRPKDAKHLVLLLSKLKAEAVAKKCEDSLVLGMDSAGYYDGKIMEKPKSYSEAFERLKALSGKGHEFYTGLTVINQKTGKVLQECAYTKIKLRKLSDEEIKLYLSEDKKYNTYALGYDPIHGISSTFIENIEGDPHSFMKGIPLSRIIDIIRSQGE